MDNNDDQALEAELNALADCKVPKPKKPNPEPQEFEANLVSAIVAQPEPIPEPTPVEVISKAPGTVINVVNQVTTNTNVEDPVDHMIQKFVAINTELMDDFRTDRDKSEDLLNYLIDLVKNNGAAAKPHHFEAMTAVLAAKLKSTADASKHMDSIAKIVSAIKNRSVTQNNINIDDILNDSD